MQGENGSKQAPRGRAKPEKKPLINEKQRRARLRLARIGLQRTGVRSSSLMSLTLGNLMVRRRPGETYKPRCLAPTVKSGGGSAMI